jgi:hypothetical protein
VERRLKIIRKSRENKLLIKALLLHLHPQGVGSRSILLKASLSTSNNPFSSFLMLLPDALWH